MTIIDKNTKKLIEENPMSLGTVNKDGTPNVIGVAFVKVISDSQIVITDNYMSQTKQNIHENNNVCIALWDKDWIGCKIIGTAEYFTEGKYKTLVEELEENKGLSAKGAILVTIKKVIKLC